MTGLTVRDKRKKKKCLKLITNSRNFGYAAEIIDSFKVRKIPKFKMVTAMVSIKCTACASNINHATQKLQSIAEVSTNVISKMSVFIFYSKDGDFLKQLFEIIKNISYGFVTTS